MLSVFRLLSFLPFISDDVLIPNSGVFLPVWEGKRTLLDGCFFFNHSGPFRVKFRFRWNINFLISVLHVRQHFIINQLYSSATSFLDFETKTFIILVTDLNVKVTHRVCFYTAVFSSNGCRVRNVQLRMQDFHRSSAKRPISSPFSVLTRFKLLSRIAAGHEEAAEVKLNRKQPPRPERRLPEEQRGT